MTRVEALLVGLTHLLIRAYQLLISPLLGSVCRFEPSCSRYADEAFRRHGLLPGGILAVRRVLRCHPFRPGGYDPVPDTMTSRKAS